jgi:hypothetical protein
MIKTSFDIEPSFCIGVRYWRWDTIVYNLPIYEKQIVTCKTEKHYSFHFLMFVFVLSHFREYPVTAS